MRRIVTILALLTLVGGVVAAGAARPATAEAASDRPQEYLALGDSIAFGFSPLGDRTSASNFVGYPTTVAEMLKLTEGLTNTACPGETTSHFIDLAGADNNCGLWRAYFPLHTEYVTSQLTKVDDFLQSHPKTLVVSIDIGANDLDKLRTGCHDEVGCVLTGLPGVLTTMSANLDTIYGHIRNTDGYRHKLVALTLYSPNYADPVTTGVIALANQVLAERTLAWRGIVADGFSAFAAASVAAGGDACAAGLLIAVAPSPLTCDPHPSAEGHMLLARAIVSALRPD